MVDGGDFSVRLSPFSPERRFQLTADALEWKTRWSAGRLAYRDIREIRQYRVRVIGARDQLSARRWRSALMGGSSRAVVLASDSYRGFGRPEDRQSAYSAFVGELIRRVETARPDLKVVWDRAGEPGGRAGRYAIQFAFMLARRLPLRPFAALASRTMRTVGPLVPEHRIGRANLAAAFPEKSPAEIEQVLTGVWDNLGRVGAEFAHLDRLCEREGQVTLTEAARNYLNQYRENRRPQLFFSAHLANWEFSACFARKIGVDLVTLVRTQHHAAIASVVSRARGDAAGAYIAVGSDVAARIKGASDRGTSIAMLVDQHVANGVEVTFFGRPCKVSPLLARLAGSLDWPIVGIRTIRMPNQTFQIDLTGPHEVARDSQGQADIRATMQTITTIVEGWIREHPEQWLWLHRRWRS